MLGSDKQNQIIFRPQTANLTDVEPSLVSRAKSKSRMKKKKKAFRITQSVPCFNFEREKRFLCCVYTALDHSSPLDNLIVIIFLLLLTDGRLAKSPQGVAKAKFYFRISISGHWTNNNVGVINDWTLSTLYTVNRSKLLFKNRLEEFFSNKIFAFQILVIWSGRLFMERKILPVCGFGNY